MGSEGDLPQLLDPVHFLPVQLLDQEVQLFSMAAIECPRHGQSLFEEDLLEQVSQGPQLTFAGLVEQSDPLLARASDQCFQQRLVAG